MSLNSSSSPLHNAVPEALAPWRAVLAGAIYRNRSVIHSRYCQLATVDAAGRPHNRTVVFRGWCDPGDRLQMVTDTRSGKMAELTTGSTWVEVCWYFPTSREQFRIAGSIVSVSAENSDPELAQLRSQAWQNLSKAGQASFFWPHPGADRTASAKFFDAEWAEASRVELTEPPSTFTLLLVCPDRVDHLQLKGEPQSRWIYQRAAIGWERREVNP